MNPIGGFYSAYDADSLDDKNHLEEGAFYVWKKEDLKRILKEDFDLFSIVFNINDFGFWEEENYVLIQNQSLEEISKKENIELFQLQKKKEKWENQLYTEREKRSKPRLDDKSLTSWNALMLKGFVDAYKALKNKKYLEIALKNANFILENLWKPEGNLLHNYKNGITTINGYLEDYCFVIDAFISLYEVTFDEKWLHYSKQMTDYCFDNFYDEKKHFFSFTSNLDEALITKHYELEDNVISASNSVMAGNLFKLHIYFENSYYEEIAQKMLSQVLPNIDYPSAFANWLNVFLNFSEENRELAICGKNALENSLLIQENYLPNIIIAGSTKPSELVFLKGRFHLNKDLFYVCQNKTCELPTTNFKEALNDLTS